MNTAPVRAGAVTYWMRRDQRAKDNWALLYACELARARGETVHVVFTHVPNTHANARVYDFMLRGLQEVEQELCAHGIPFDVLIGPPAKTLHAWCEAKGIGAIVADFSPLARFRSWTDKVAKRPIPLFEVDAHNIIPAWIASEKKEFAARTIRPKIHRLLPEFLTDIPTLPKQGKAIEPKVKWGTVRKALIMDDTPPVAHPTPGPKAANTALTTFIKGNLSRYDQDRNDPTIDGQSGLSPYLHFGHLSPQRAAYAALSAKAPAASRDAFLEELVVRRELSDNYCLYEPRYRTTAGFHPWAARTIDAHRKDVRAYSYSRKQWEQAKTHDSLWNAAQREMMQTGKMHGFMRMYWAKKIAEWSASPEAAMATAIFLNDRYSLDGRDPNGYVGIAWSIGGVHDRAWGNRPVTGTIRSMTEGGCRRKFDVDAYIARWGDVS